MGEVHRKENRHRLSPEGAKDSNDNDLSKNKDYFSVVKEKPVTESV